MRKITHIVKRDTGRMIGEWSGEKAELPDEELFQAFSMRSLEVFGLALDRQMFDEQYEIVRYEEVATTN